MFGHLERERLLRIEQMLVAVLQNQNLQEIEMSDILDATNDLTAKVAAETTVDQSAVTLLTGLTKIVNDLKSQVAQAADVPAALAAVKAAAAAMDANQAALAAAVTANTPAA